MNELTFEGVIVEPIFLWGDGTESEAPLSWKSDDYIVVNDTTTLREVLDFLGTTLTIEFLDCLELSAMRRSACAWYINQYILGNVA